MHRYPLAFAAFSLVVCVAPGSRAQEAPDGAVRDAPSREAASWYGWQTLTVDAIATGVTAIGLATFSDPANNTASTPPSAVAVGLGLTTYALGPPAVHAAHGRWVTALLDTGIRLASPVVGALVGGGVDAAISPHQCQGSDGICYPNLLGVGIGTVAGFVGATAFDAAFFARERPPASAAPAGSVRARTREVAIAPTLVAGARGMSLGVVGSF